MSEKYDAIIIGAGIIGCCTAFELAKKGYRTLNVDKLPAAGYGSTSNSCAVIRLHYSTPNGVAIARESYFYWLDWEKYLGVKDSSGMARYINYGCLVIKTARNKFLKNVYASLAVAFRSMLSRCSFARSNSPASARFAACSGSCPISPYISAADR